MATQTTLVKALHETDATLDNGTDTHTTHISPMCVAPNCTIIDEDYAIAVMHIHTRYTHKLYTHVIHTRYTHRLYTHVIHTGYTHRLYTQVIHTGWRTDEGFHTVFV